MCIAMVVVIHDDVDRSPAHLAEISEKVQTLVTTYAREAGFGARGAQQPVVHGTRQLDPDICADSTFRVKVMVPEEVLREVEE